jgi:hypothetical protein
MSGGSGKFTTYGTVSNPDQLGKQVMMKKLFGQNTDPSKLPPQMTIDPGKEEDIRKAILAIATAKVDANGVGGIQPSDGKQVGDLMMLPGGADLNFNNNPDVTSVSWKNPGDQANPYTPDISSPGVGNTQGTDKKTDPKLSITDIQATHPGAGKTANTANPSETGKSITAANKLGVAGPLGKSS